MSAVSIVDIARVALGWTPKGRLIAVLGAFFDDSGTDISSPVTVIGGLLGTEGQWEAFAQAWSRRLECPFPGKPKLRKFHLSPCRARQDEFRDYTWGEIDSITYEFRRIIVDAGFFTIAVGVNKVAWNELITGAIADELGKP